MKCTALALTLISAVFLAQAGRSQERGVGYLEIAFAESEFSLSLVAPSAEIVGFGGSAETDDTRALVAGAISDLSKPLELFVLPDEAGCFATSANVLLSSEGLGQESGTAQADDPLLNTKFQADYKIQCMDLGAVGSIEFAYFDRFPNTENLIVRVDRSGSVRSHSITRAAPELTLE